MSSLVDLALYSHPSMFDSSLGETEKQQQKIKLDALEVSLTTISNALKVEI